MVLFAIDQRGIEGQLLNSNYDFKPLTAEQQAKKVIRFPNFLHTLFEMEPAAFEIKIGTAHNTIQRATFHDFLLLPWSHTVVSSFYMLLCGRTSV